MDNIDFRILGNRIQTIRNNEGLTQEEFASKIGVTRQTLSGMESGRAVKTNIEPYSKICEIGGCDIDFLLGRIDCKTHDSSFIHDYTGLSDEAIENLFFSNHNKRLMNFLNYLLTCEKETDKGNTLLLNYIAIRLEILKDNYRMGILSQNEEAGLLFQINTEIYNAITDYLKESKGDQDGKYKEN